MMNRLKKHDLYSKGNDSKLKNLKIALSEMSKVCSELHLPDHVHEKAAHLYRQILKEDLVKGRSIDGFVSASVYAICRKEKIPRSISEVAKASALTEHDVKYHYRLIIRELGFKPPIDGPKKFISSLCSKFRLGGSIEKESVNILEEARDRRLVMGKNPRGVAAAVLYLACQEKDEDITQAELASAADTSEVTMRKRFNEYESFITFQ
jgi:transcription initiation factor TFIIB